VDSETVDLDITDKNEASLEADEDSSSKNAFSALRLAETLGLKFMHSLEEVNPPQDLLLGEFSRLIGSWGKQYKVIPIFGDETSVTIAISDPLNIEAVSAIAACYEKQVKLIVAPEEEITKAINNAKTSLMSGRDSSLESEDSSDNDEFSGSLKIDVTDDEDDDAPIIRYVNTLIFRAATQRASDIHIEPFENGLKVRFRVDGVLQDIDQEGKVFQAAILSRIKVMAGLDIAEKRLPQDGRIGLKIAGNDVDIRVSTVPTRYGERIVMRLLDKSSVALNLDILGLSQAHRHIVERVIVKSYGIVLVTGPTGSGKTTTLYACLSQINSEDKNILTVEDPIEYELNGIGQMQVNPKIGFTFASGLRSILRQDPDVIMVGEIRDLETAEIAIQASLTGHLVFSTLHTNDAPGAVTRLLDMGVEPFLISSSLLAVVAQRLVRTLCPECKVPVTYNEEQCKELGIDPSILATNTVYGPKEGGCPVCQHGGYKGRMGIHEVLMIDEEVQAAIMQRSNAGHIRAASPKMTTLRKDAAAKILKGYTSFEEVIRVTQEETIA
jgi:general secretion pathway protein E